MRKSFTTTLKQGRTNYIYYQHLYFLKDHVNIKSIPESTSKDSNNTKSQIPFSSASTSQAKFSDFEKIVNNISPSQKNVLQDTPNPFEKFKKPTENVTEKVVPPMDKFASRKEKQLEEVDKEITEIARNAIQSITNNDEDCYIQAIKQALRNVSEDLVMDCVSGILEIILKYQCENKV